MGLLYFTYSITAKYNTTVQNKLAAPCKSIGRLFTTNTSVSIRPQRKTVNRKTSTEIAGDLQCNRPLNGKGR
jgi:hypothetical protein